MTSDSLVARVAGDEFIVAVAGNDATAANPVVSSLLSWTAKPIQVDSHAIRVSASIGSSQSTFSGRHVSSLIADADLAMYRAKANGKNQHVLCTPELRAEYDSRQKLGEELRDALDRDELGEAQRRSCLVCSFAELRDRLRGRAA